LNLPAESQKGQPALNHHEKKKVCANRECGSSGNSAGFFELCDRESPIPAGTLRAEGLFLRRRATIPALYFLLLPGLEIASCNFKSWW